MKMGLMDVGTELIQTEIHHVRTLKIMGNLFRKAMLEDLQVEPTTVQKIFPCVDELSQIHERFLAQLLERRRESLAHDSNKNFVIDHLGDILVSQFSGSSAEQLRNVYGEFCSKHTKALKEYKDLLARDKRFQQFIRRMTRSPLLRRHGVPECILLVTQRITKYPVLIERILKNSKEDSAESAELSRALGLVKDLISSINEEVHAWEMKAQLWEVHRRLDGRSKAQIPWENRPGATFGRDELLRRKLLHSGGMQWRTPGGRFKELLVLLLTDVLVFLQEKDQKYTFPTLDKPAVVSLHNLLVRDIANQQSGLFLLSAAPPEMYELHAPSRQHRDRWMRLIQQSVTRCPSPQEFPLIETEVEASLRKLKARILHHDRTISALLEQKVGLFADILALGTGAFFRSEGVRGEKLLHEAIREVESLRDIFTSTGREQNSPGDTETWPSPSNGDGGSYNGTPELGRVDTDTGQRDGNGNQVLQRGPQEEINQHLVNLYSLLHQLQAVVSQQDTLLELQLQEAPEKSSWAEEQKAAEKKGEEEEAERNPEQNPERNPERNSERNLERNPEWNSDQNPDLRRTELELLRKQHGLVQEELGRCRRLCQERAEEAAELERRLRESEGERERLERELEEARGGTRPGRDPRRRSLPTGEVTYSGYSPGQLSHSPPSPGLPFHAPPFSPCSHPELEFGGGGGGPQPLPEEEELLEDEEALGGPHSPPHSPREFLRMQDIPEEVENSQELKEES
ncbi:LOW QUALITY PROTEIN: rho guanine nucleotide exchange factor 2 [Phaethornis superciliosus]